MKAQPVRIGLSQSDKMGGRGVYRGTNRDLASFVLAALKQNARRPGPGV